MAEQDQIEQTQSQIIINEPTTLNLQDIVLTPELRSALERLKFKGLPNVGNNAVGGTVPTVIGLKVAQVEVYDTRAIVWLRFIEPKLNAGTAVDYNVYVSGAILANELSAPFKVSGSPAKIEVPLSPYKTGVITFTVQTVFKNGYSSAPNNSPTTAVQIQRPIQVVNSDTLITDNSTITTNGTKFTELILPANSIKDKSIIRLTYLIQLTHNGIGGQTGITAYLNNGFSIFGALTNTQTIGGSNSEWNKLELNFFFGPGTSCTMDAFGSFYRSESNANITRAGSVTAVAFNKAINNKIYLETNMGGGVGQSMFTRSGWSEIFNNAGNS